jgi:hypothetical protein
MGNVIATIEHDGCTAEIHEQAMPGHFTILYKTASGEVMEEAELTGVSTYRQRQVEIHEHLEQLCAGRRVAPSEALKNPGEY